jgi:hypothetical protein
VVRIFTPKALEAVPLWKAMKAGMSCTFRCGEAEMLPTLIASSIHDVTTFVFVGEGDLALGD